MKTFTNFLKVIAIVAVIGIAAFAPTKVYAQQAASVQNTFWANQAQNEVSKGMRSRLGIIFFSVIEFGESNFTMSSIPWGLTNSAIQTNIPLSGLEHNVPKIEWEGTFTQSGDTINLIYSDGYKETFKINAKGMLVTPSGIEKIKVPGLDVAKWPDSMKQ